MNGWYVHTGFIIAEKSKFASLWSVDAVSVKPFDIKCWYINWFNCCSLYCILVCATTFAYKVEKT